MFLTIFDSLLGETCEALTVIYPFIMLQHFLLVDMCFS